MTLKINQLQFLKNRRFLLYFLLILYIGTYLFFIFPQLVRPIFGYQILTWNVAKDIALSGASAVDFFHHPPLYAYLISFCFNIFGINELSARLIGIFCFLAMPILINLLAKEITDVKSHLSVSSIASLLFLTSFMTIQGSLTIDMADTAFYTLVITLFYFFLIKTEHLSLGRRSIILGILYCLCLLTKITTSLACLISIPLAYFLNEDISKGIKLSFGVFAIGMVSFLIIWLSFCYFIIGIDRLYEPLVTYTQEFRGNLLASNIAQVKKIGLDVFRLTLWFSPFLLILSFLASLDIFKKSPKNATRTKELQLGVFCGIVFLVYAYAKATFSSFPKYVIPILPILFCLVAKSIHQRIGDLFTKRNLFILLYLLLGGMIYYSIFVGDWIYSIFLLREAKLNGLLNQVFIAVINKYMIYLLFPILIFFVSLRTISTSLVKRLVYVLFISLIASNFTLNFIQRKSGYSLNYAYGAEGIDDLKRFLEERGPLEVFSPREGFIANVRGVKFRSIASSKYDIPRVFLDFIEENEPECLIYGLATNNVKQLKTVFGNHMIRQYLDKHYEISKIGSYNVLLKRSLTR